MSGRYIKFTNYVVNVNNSALSIYRILSSWQNWHSLILSLWTAPAMMVSDHNSLLTYLTLVCKQNDGFETSWTWWKKSQTLCYLSSVVDFMFECWCVCMLLATDLVDTLYPLILMESKCVFFPQLYLSCWQMVQVLLSLHILQSLLTCRWVCIEGN